MASDSLLTALIVLWAMPPMLLVGYEAYADVIGEQTHDGRKHMAALFAYLYVTLGIFLVGVLVYNLYEVFT